MDQSLRCSDFRAHCPAGGFFPEAQCSLSCSFMTFPDPSYPFSPGPALLLTGSSACPPPPSLAAQHCVGLTGASPPQRTFPSNPSNPILPPAWRPCPPPPLCHGLSLSPCQWLVVCMVTSLSLNLGRCRHACSIRPRRPGHLAGTECAFGMVLALTWSSLLLLFSFCFDPPTSCCSEKSPQPQGPLGVEKEALPSPGSQSAPGAWETKGRV